MTIYDTVTPPAPPEVTAGVRATYAAFIGCGFAFASWAPRIPHGPDGPHLGPGTLGPRLPRIGAGGIAALVIAGVVVSRFHSRRTVAAMAVLMAIALTGIALGYLVGVVPLAAGLFVFGFSSGAWDVAMNVQGAAVERRLGRSIMPRFHAGYSVGAGAGALIGAGMVALHVPVPARLIAPAAVGAATIHVAVRGL